MIDRKAVDFFAHQSRARDVMVAEREVVLAYALHFLDHKGILARLAFKGGTALRKLVFGAGGRFSEDLDFTLNAGDARNRRGLVVLKLWQVQERRQFTIFEKLQSATYKWDELEHLLPPGRAVERDPMLATIVRCFSGLTAFDETERAVLEDLSHGSGRNEYVAAQLREKVRRRYDLAGR